jgi:adenylylsulfate kinase
MASFKKNVVVWITGLPGSGKSTIAEEVKKLHPEFFILRMDELRRLATPKPTYSEEEREILYRALVFMAKTLWELGHSVIIDATGNLRRWRELARREIKNFMEVYLECPLEICEERELKRMESFAAPEDIYKKGRAGWPVPGITAPYEAPLRPEVKIDTRTTSPQEGAARIEEFLESRR